MDGPGPVIRVGEDDVHVFEVSITDGVVNQQAFDLHEPHHRGRNWMAIITPNRARPGGLEREWLGRLRATFYRIENVRAGDFLEVGADYITGGGRRYPKRAYFRVLVIRTNTWVLREVPEPPEDSLTIPPYTPEAEAAKAALASAEAAKAALASAVLPEVLPSTPS